MYFHCAPEGKKLDAIKENPNVCFSAESLAEADGDKEKACTAVVKVAVEEITGKRHLRK